MSVASEIAAYKVQVINDITSKTAINSISPENVGDADTDLADLIQPWLEIVEAGGGDIYGSTVAPSPIDGSDGDEWYQITGSQFILYRKESGTWVAKVNETVGVTFPDGPLINLRVSVIGSNVTVTPGGWVINNIIYTKGTSTGFTVPTADINFRRYDLIYANTSGQILYQTGVASSSPSFPATPANTIVVDYIIVPSSSSGALPYSYYGSLNSNPNTTKFISGTSDSNGEYDASGDGLGEFPIATFYDQNEILAPFQYDNANKKIFGMSATTAFTARFTI